MRLHFAEPELAALDDERGSSLVLTAFDGERPLRGLAGRVDWRLCGRLSTLLGDGFLSADEGDVLVTPIDGRLPWTRLLFFGLGPQAAFGAERYAAACARIFEALARLGEIDVALALPGRIGLDVGLRQALWGLRNGLIGAYDSAGLAALSICLLVDGEARAELIEPVAALEQEINEALAREAEHIVARRQPALRGEGGRELAAAPTPARPTAQPRPRRGWQSGVVKIGVPYGHIGGGRGEEPGGR